MLKLALLSAKPPLVNDDRNIMVPLIDVADMYSKRRELKYSAVTTVSKQA